MAPGRWSENVAAAVVGAHHAAELDADEQPLRAVRVGGDPAHVVRPRPRREAPARARRDVLERLELGELAAVASDEEPARLGAGVQRAVGRADRDGEHVGLGEVEVLEGPAVVPAQVDAGAARADEHPGAVGGDALRPGPFEHGRGRPRVVVAPQRDHVAVAGAEEDGHVVVHSMAGAVRGPGARPYFSRNALIRSAYCSASRL